MALVGRQPGSELLEHLLVDPGQIGARREPAYCGFRLLIADRLLRDHAKEASALRCVDTALATARIPTKFLLHQCTARLASRLQEEVVEVGPPPDRPSAFGERSPIARRHKQPFDLLAALKLSGIDVKVARRRLTGYQQAWKAQD